MHRIRNSLSKWHMPAFVLICSLTSFADARWEHVQYEDTVNNGQHVSITGTAEGWADANAFPKLRIACDRMPDGEDLYLGFHFPAGHGFLGQSSRNEPVKFRVSGPEPGGIVQETIEYLSNQSSEYSVFRTLLVSDGLASNAQAGDLLLDLYHGSHLHVQFMHQPLPYTVHYDLAGFAEKVDTVLDNCPISGFPYPSLDITWADYIRVVEVAGALQIERPVVGAAQPLDEPPE